MVNPQFAGGRPTMFTCGDEGNAKKTGANSRPLGPTRRT
jgi:hypothetical protein